MTFDHGCLLLMCLVASACSNVEPRRQAGDSNLANDVVVDQAFFETHPESEAAWLIYAFDRIATLREYGSAAACEREYLLEVAGRRKMIDYWVDNGTPGTDRYLDFLIEIEQLGFLEEYVIAAFGQPGWTVPATSMVDLDVAAFSLWGQQNLKGHSGQTRAQVEYYCPAVAGASYPPIESFFGLQGRRCDKSEELEGVLERWYADRKSLTGRPLAASSGMQFLGALDGLGTEVTWVPEPVAQLNFLAGFCAIESSDWEAAMRYLEGAVALAPHNYSVRLELVHVSILTREFGAADEQIEFVLANTQDPCLVAQALRKRGFIQFERGELAEAYATYTESLNHEPASQVAQNEIRSIQQIMEVDGFTNLPPPFFVAPPSNQLTTQCTIGPGKEPPDDATSNLL